MRIDDLAFVRSGDKGDTSNVVVLARDQDAYAALEAGLLPEAIADYMAGNVKGPVVVHKMPKLRAFNVVMHGALGGGATNTLRFDSTGKSICSVLSRMELPGSDPGSER
ncbi:MAG: hypothetical protein WAP37_09320 [Solirubrobacterales bacterium]